MLVPKENRTLTSFRNQIIRKTKAIEVNNGISLLTAHMSKGLQFDVVFIMGLEGTFPDYRAIKSGSVQLSHKEMNNMYVAVTRAKRLCYMTYPARKRCLGVISRIKCLPDTIKILWFSKIYKTQIRTHKVVSLCWQHNGNKNQIASTI